MPYKEDVKKLKQKLDEQKKIFDAQDKRAGDAKKAGQSEDEAFKAAKPTTEEETQLKALQAEIDELDTKCAESKEYEDMREKSEALRSALSQPGHRPEYVANARDGQPEIKSPGQAIIEQKDFKQWLEQVAPLGKEVNAKLKLESPTVELAELGLSDIGLKDLVMSVPTTAGGAFVRRDYGPWPIDLPLRPLTIRDVITVLRTGSNLIEYVRVNALNRAAKIVPEATSTTDDAALKPQAGMNFEIVQTGVKTIAVWMPITRTILSDVPMLESMITNFLRTDIELELEEEIITGPGGANHFVGLENTPNLTPQPFDTDMLTTTRKARTKAMIVGRARSTGFLMNPLDWESFDLTKDLEGRYYFGGPLAMGTRQLWGLPVIESEVIPQGTAYTGDLRQLVVWDRQAPTIHVTDSNRDFFERNIISILYEGRWAFGVLRPPAVVKVDLHAGANS